jgi:hypothetical protein
MGKNVQTTPKYPKVKTIGNNGYRCNFGNTCKSKVFFTIVKNISSTRIISEGNETQGHWHKTNLLSQKNLGWKMFKCRI